MTKTVLIVEDNELNMKLFRDLLEVQGLATLETSNGMEVLDLVRSNRPDLILMDIQLPEVSGLDVIKWLKADEDLKAIPIIAVTAFAMKGDEDKIRQGGCEDYISKPISVTRFIEAVQKQLNKAADTALQAEDTTETEDADDAPAFEIRDMAGDEDPLDDGLTFEDEDESDILEPDNRG